MFYEGETVIMDEGTSIMQDVIIIKCNPHYCLIQDEDGDQWEVEIERLSELIIEN